MLLHKNRVEEVCRIIQFADCFSSGSTRSWREGGLALMWKNEGDVEILGSCNHYIDFQGVHQ